jgi:hypothetical protein
MPFRESVRALLAGLKEEPAMKLLTGMTSREALKGRTDKEAHSAASEAMAGRIGAGPARGIGIAKEAFTGLTSKLGGGDFFGEQGFDVEDLEANEEGIRRAGPTPQASAVLALLRSLR